MPRLSVYFVRSSLLCMALGFTIGALMLAFKGGASTAYAWRWFSVHIILLLVGWLLQLALGVAYWIFPRLPGNQRGREWWAWGAFFCLQAGLILTTITITQTRWPVAGNLLAPAMLLQGMGISAFVVHLWPRIRTTLPMPQKD